MNRFAQSSTFLEKRKNKILICTRKTFSFHIFIHISPRIRIKDTLSSDAFWHLAQSFYCVEKCCHCKTCFPCTILTLHIPTNTAGVPNYFMKTHLKKMFRIVVCACVYSTWGKCRNTKEKNILVVISLFHLSHPACIFMVIQLMIKYPNSISLLYLYRTKLLESN